MNVYTVKRNGITLTMQLDERDARRMGLWVDEEPVVENTEAKPRNKSRRAVNRAVSRPE